MALKSTIYKAELNVVDLDRNYYATIQDGEVWLRDEEGREAHLKIGTIR